MKKVLFSLFFLILFMVPSMASYTVDSMNVTANVDRDGKTQVSALIQVTFHEETKSLAIPLPDPDATRIDADSFRSRVSRTAEGTDVIISRSGGFLGTQTFSLSYTVPATEDIDDEADAYHIGFLSSRWGAEVGACAFSLVLPGPSGQMPENFSLDPEIFSGYYGSLSPYDCDLTVTDSTVSGTVKNMMAYDSLEANLTLPEGYFYVREAAVQKPTITVVTIAMAMVLLLIFFYWWKKIFVFPESSSQRMLMPEGLLACQLPQVLNAVTVDMPALILEWANLGYLSIGRSHGGQPVLVKNLPMGSERSESEQRLYARIFGDRDAVVATPGRFAAGASQFRKHSKSDLSHRLLDPKGGSLTLVDLGCRLLCGFGCGYMLANLLPEGGGFVFVAVILGLVGFVYAGHLSAFLYRLLTQKYTPMRQLWIPVLALILLIGGLVSGSFTEMLAGILAMVLSAFLKSLGPRRNRRGQEAVYQVRGLRKLYRRISWQTVRAYSGKDDRFFQKHLPSALALGCHKAFAKNCLQTKVPRPEWLLTTGPQKSSAKALLKQLRPLIRQLREAFR